ncbi:MAG TPA: type IV toxin-antitoxin system AbiEi family antitoxin domain-containing protein [Nocardioides sp.]|uniref:type IV toxin-antitoxin system AbiEi family antitoxin domain-containing protein n=1 Tax=Nocardioides sp. TaxID=35761 RepID=UPI002E31BE49|nr:type IV toxin-antitoxin system AbiEi family antitoxin domain-containing protein [Nocardioides sp.]HEX5086748.1 type IV toxin-antitoxin system AbiEi family antitoxin domain-containing protein [Nocardioides sp.]
MASQRGLLTRNQALDAGLSPTTIRHLIRTGVLVIVRRGVYADGELWRSLDPYRGQHQLRTRAALMTMRRSWVVSHDSAGHEHELDLLLPPEPHVHITRPGWTKAWTEYGVKHHLAPYSPEQVVERHGLRVHDLARTAVDIAREHGSPYGEVACNSAMRLGVTRAELEAACEPMRNWPHVTRTRAAVAFARPGVGSVAETLGIILVEELAIAAHMETQFPVRRADGTVAWLDIVLGCHGFEVDGKGKYIPVTEGGLAKEPPFEVLWAEKRRERDIHQVGLGTSRIFWEDFWAPRRGEALRRLRSDYEETVARFGTRLPERLVREAREIRGRAGA